MAVQGNFYWLYYGAARKCKIAMDSNAIIEAKDAANDAIEEMADIRNWHFLNDMWHMQTNQYRYTYPLPAHCDKIISMFSTERDVPIYEIDNKRHSYYDPNPSNEGDPYFYMQRGYGVQRQPHSKLTIKSDDASDTGELYIRGFSYGREVSETITLNGTTGVESLYEYSLYSKVEPATDGYTGNVTGTCFSDVITVFTVTAGNDDDITSFTQPTTVVTFTSAAGASDAGVAVVIEGVTSDTETNVKEAGVLDASGAYTTTASFNKIYPPSKQDSTGVITATDSDGNTLWSAGPTDNSVEYLQIAFLNPPDSTDTIRLTFKRKTTRLVNDYDPLPIPTKYSTYLRALVMAKLYDYMGHQDNKARDAYRKYEMGLKKMKKEDDANRKAWIQQGRNEPPTEINRLQYPYGGYSIISGD